jgi:hypothetical protein
MSVNPIPEGFHTIAPNIIVKNVDEAVSFNKRAFGAEEILRLTTPDGRVTHCELKFGDSRVNVGESNGRLARTQPACPDFCGRLGCSFRAGGEGGCRSIESRDRYVFWVTGRVRPRSIRQHMDNFDAQGKRFGRGDAAPSQCTRCLTHKVKHLGQPRG